MNITITFDKEIKANCFKPIKLIKPLCFKIKINENKGIFIEHEELDISINFRTSLRNYFSEVLKIIAEEINILWICTASLDDNLLSRNACKVKKYFLEHVDKSSLGKDDLDVKKGSVD